MSKNMQVIELSAPGHLCVSHRYIPETPKDGVVLKSSAVSICSTDVSHFHGNLQSETYPVILGHEFVGTVVDVGSDCDSSLLGRRLVYFGQTDFGGLAEYRAIRPLFAGDNRALPFKTDRYFRDDERAAAIIIPGSLSDREAPLIEPITAVLRSIMSHPPLVGSRILVLGGGPCGAIAGAIFQNLHAPKEVTVLERNVSRRQVARLNYADSVFESACELEKYEGEHFDYIFDALPPLIDVEPEQCPRRGAMRVAKPGSKYVLYGASQTMQPIDTWLLLAKGITLSSAAFDVDFFPMYKTALIMKTARDLLLRRVIDPSWIMTGELSFWKPDGVIQFFDSYHLTSHLKTVIRFDA